MKRFLGSDDGLEFKVNMINLTKKKGIDRFI